MNPPASMPSLAEIALAAPAPGAVARSTASARYDEIADAVRVLMGKGYHTKGALDYLIAAGAVSAPTPQAWWATYRAVCYRLAQPKLKTAPRRPTKGGER